MKNTSKYFVETFEFYFVSFKLQDFLEAEYLSEQVDSIKELADLITRLERLHCKDLGLHLIDQELSSKYSK